MQNRPPNDLIVSLALSGLGVLALVSVLLRYAGNVAAFLTGHPAPTGAPSSGSEYSHARSTRERRSGRLV